MEERSAGAIIFRKRPVEGRDYLLLRYPAGHWDFPKGNIEKGEAPEQTMIREVREETGIAEVHRVPDFKETIEYYYVRGGRRVHKEVIFFLAEVPTEAAVVLSYEHQDSTWLPFSEAIARVTYSNSRRLLRSAEDWLTGGHGSLD